LKANDIVRVLKGSMAFVSHEDYEIDQLLTDSRKTGDLSGCLFFAIPTKRNTGSRYVYDLYERGVRNFVVPINAEEEYVKQFRKCSEANFWYVKNVVKSLQQVAADHRSQYAIPVVGITGSNGKTIVKDWIVQMLGGECRIVSSPRSYNSQIGVPLSVWQMSDEDEMGVFEAGISEAGEMDNLREVIKPTIGIFTNIGQAHDENFLTRSQKVAEKLQLFTHCQVLIYSTDHKDIHSAISAQEGFRSVTRYTWGHGEDNVLQLVDVKQQGHGSTITMKREGQPFVLDIPFGDRASVENAMHCIALLCYLGYDNETIADKCRKLTSVAMRLEMNEAINNCLLVNDS
jgi:alanine racemase